MYRALMGRIRSSSPLRRSVNDDEHTALFIRSTDCAKTVLPLRVDRVRENGQRARKKTFDNLDRKPMFLALGPVAPVPVEAVRL